MSDWSSDVCSADLDDRLFACPCRADGVGAARARRPGRPCRRASRARSGLVAAPAFLPDARRNAVPRRRTRRAIPHLRAFLPPVAAADRALLCRPLNDHGQAAPARGQASRRDRPCDFVARSEEHTSELQSLMRISYAVFCLKKKKTQTQRKSNPLTRP